MELSELASMLGGRVEGNTLKLPPKPEKTSVMLVSGKSSCLLSLVPLYATAICDGPDGETMYVFERKRGERWEEWRLVKIPNI